MGSTPARSEGGLPQPGPDGGRIPIQPWMGGTLARSRWGSTPSLAGGYPGVAPSGPGQDTTPHLDLDLGWGTPPPLPVRTTGVLATRRSVCLLRSRRRTFLFTHAIKVTVLLSDGFDLVIVTKNSNLELR